MSEPLIEIGLPVYNGAQTLGRALDSLLAQSHENLRVHVCDNASTDATPDIAADHARRDQRVRLVRHPRNLGVLANFQAALAQARGPYFMFAADDDWWDPQFASKLLALLEHDPGAAMAMCAVARYKPENGPDSEPGQVPSGPPLDVLRFTDPDPNTATKLEMCLACFSPRKLNIFIYGLFRREPLARAMASMPRVSAMDRYLMSHFLLRRRARYLDEPLYHRTLQPCFAARHPSDGYARIKHASDHSRVDLKPVAWLAGRLAREDGLRPRAWPDAARALCSLTRYQFQLARALRGKRRKHPQPLADKP